MPAAIRRSSRRAIHSHRFPPAPLLWFSALPILLIAGCDLDYYGHLARGQARLIFECEPLELTLAQTSDASSGTGVDRQRAQRLRLVEAIRKYAEHQVGLDTNSNYTCMFDTGGGPVGWNVSACPPDRFEAFRWSFPVVGELPYKGFFDRERAEAEREALSARGFDVLLRPLAAFSTLGYFSDPILSPMLEYSPDRLAELLFHELTHGSLFFSGHTDFNESLATFVGQTASEDFLIFHFGSGTPLIEQARADRADRARFRSFMVAVVAELDSLYRLMLPLPEVMVQREAVFRRAKQRYRTVREGFELLTYDGFLDWDVNNARLMSFRRYNRDLGQFHALYVRVGLRLDLMLEALEPCEGTADPWACLAAAGTG